jgi:TRAP-type C4-dicarboxylate transport system permease small subunit
MGGLASWLLLLSFLGYLSLGVLGLSLSGVSLGSSRYHPAMSFAGLGIALVPCWFGLLLALKHFNLLPSTTDFQQRVAIAIVVAASVYATIMALRHVIAAVRGERRERREARRAHEAGGC